MLRAAAAATGERTPVAGGPTTTTDDELAADVVGGVLPATAAGMAAVEAGGKRMATGGEEGRLGDIAGAVAGAGVGLTKSSFSLLLLPPSGETDLFRLPCRRSSRKEHSS